MHDKYAYESSQMAFLNTNLEYLMAFGLAGISIVTDSFSAMQYGNVRVKRDERGLTTAFSHGILCAEDILNSIDIK